MYEEPYRWVEAVGNRRQYLDEQFKQGSPVVALAYDAGHSLLTVSKGTPKLYEIYDRLALGGMGHPADLEKLRFTLLEMAHVEGFNRSPSDVTGKPHGEVWIAPVIKQAFEEVYKAPFIVKILSGGTRAESREGVFLVINYDGTFEEEYTIVRSLLRQDRLSRTWCPISGNNRRTRILAGPGGRHALRAWAVGDHRSSECPGSGERGGRPQHDQSRCHRCGRTSMPICVKPWPRKHIEVCRAGSESARIVEVSNADG